jgi:3-ketosteroid 9alpha-monooxygenase subunit A
MVVIAIGASRVYQDWRCGVGEISLPSPFGWFAIGESSDFAPGEAKPAHWFDQDLVVFRSEDGTIAALDAYCPHMGAHLGYGGTVKDGALECPFHGWRWAGDGSCLAVPYGRRGVPKIRAGAVPVVEQDGVVLLWRGQGEPTWYLPPLLDDGQWSPTTVARRTLTSHPQEILENITDFAHFLFVHKSHMIEPISEVSADGNVFTYRAQSAPEAVDPDVRIDAIPVEGGVFAYGPGLGVNTMTAQEVPVPQLTRVYITPINDREITLLCMVNIRIDENTDEAAAEALMPVISEAVFDQIDADLVIWGHKRYVEHPAFQNPQERMIGAFRRWFTRFYDDPSAPTAARPSLAQATPA